MPFTSNWGTFTAAFEHRFSPLDTAETAHEVLKKIQQGKDSMAEYLSKFDQYTGQTGWSDLDHRQRFYDSLNEKVKDFLAITDRPHATFAELTTAAQTIDQRLHQHEAEKKGSTSHNMSQGTLTVDPNAMQVDATQQGSSSNAAKNCSTYTKWMRGKCYGCGDTKHVKKDGNHERDVCNHCGKTGHRSPICFSKYMGKAKTAKAAATQESSSSTTDPPKQTASATSTPAKDSMEQADMLAQLMKCIKDQDKDLRLLKCLFR